MTASDIISLIEYWRYLDMRYFSRLDSRFQRTVKKFELCLLRHYLVHGMISVRINRKKSCGYREGRGREGGRDGSRKEVGEKDEEK